MMPTIDDDPSFAAIPDGTFPLITKLQNHAIVEKKATQLGLTLSHRGQMLEDLPKGPRKAS